MYAHSVTIGNLAEAQFAEIGTRGRQMITRLQVDGFKNLTSVDVAFGPFTCIAGPNGVGKSNLFDAIGFLCALSDHSLLDAALGVRAESGRAATASSIFHRTSAGTKGRMTLGVEMLVPHSGIDDLGQPAVAAYTFLRYDISLARAETGLEIEAETLSYVKKGDAATHLKFEHSRQWRESVVRGARRAPLISTQDDGRILLHQDKGRGYLGGGSPRPHLAKRLPRTVLSTANAAENSTAVLAKREMQSWRLMQLEPSALREPDSFMASAHLEPRGEHLPAALARLQKADPDVCEKVANRLSELLQGVSALRLDENERRELWTLMLTDTDGIEHEERALSDGSLRFLALAALAHDPAATGVICLEEPENGIHPTRVPAMIRLLGDLATDPMSGVGEENPLRQVIVNTHSPVVVGQVSQDDLILATSVRVHETGEKATVPSFRCLSGSWRQRSPFPMEVASKGVLHEYFSAFWGASGTVDGQPRPRRVLDRPEVQLLLPGFGGAADGD